MSTNGNVIASAMKVAEESSPEFAGEPGEVHLSRSESALLLSAFFTLAVSMISFTTL